MTDVNNPYRAATAEELEIASAPIWENSIKELSDAIHSISLTPGPKGDTGAQGPQGIQGVQGPSGNSFTLKGNYPTLSAFNAGSGSYPGSMGDAFIIESDGSLMVYGTYGWFDAGDLIGPQGIQGPAGQNGTSPNLQSVAENILPDITNTRTLGSSTKRWADVFIGPNTLNIIDKTLLTNAAVTINNGVFNIEGIAQAQLPDVKVNNLTFNDNTVQTTAAVAQVNPDWNATTGKAQILNKPDLTGYTSPTPISYNPVISSAGGSTQIAFTGTPATGSYMKHGKLVHFRVKVSYTTFTSFGSGNGNQYYVTLPFAPAEDYVFRNALYKKASNGANYELSVHAIANSTTMSLWHSAGSGNENVMNHTYPTSPATADYFYISGTYEAA
jgi:hypothetical protein